MRHLLFVALLSTSSTATAQDTELFSVLAEDTTFCTETTVAIADTSCGEIFLTYHGFLTWPSLVNAGPVTLSVKSHRGVRPPIGTTLPLYVQFDNQPDGVPCLPNQATDTILVTNSTSICGGTWETIGPLDLREFNIPLGGLYRVQLVAIGTAPSDLVQLFSAGVSQLRIELATAATPVSWSQIKQLYR